MSQTAGIEEAIKAGGLEVRLAASAAEIEQAQRLRYRVFCEEMGAEPSAEARLSRMDIDVYDESCDHLLVVDNEKSAGDYVVGTYRLLRKSALKPGQSFYTAGEYDISKALAFGEGELMELGRSCVHENYRTRAPMQLLWRGIAAYSARHNIKLMIGCASFPGSSHMQHEKELSYLYHNHLAPEEIRTKALPGLRKPMDSVPSSDCFNSLPPLIKGYLRLGGFVGDGAVEDLKYNTTDVCIVLKTDLVTDRYLNRYKSEFSRT